MLYKKEEEIPGLIFTHKDDSSKFILVEKT